MKLILLRHGRTAANEARLYCGWTDIALSPGGRAELEALRARVNYPDAKGLRRLTSGMRRADETLELLYGARPDARMPAFREMNFGAFEMRAYAELKARADYQAWISDETGEVSTPGGESAADFRRRVCAAADALESDALLVCHGGVIAAMMARWFPREGRNLYQWQPGNGLGYIVELDGARRAYRAIGPER